MPATARTVDHAVPRGASKNAPPPCFTTFDRHPSVESAPSPSRGVLLPAEVLRRYGVGDTLIMEQRPGEIVLRPKRTPHRKLNWAETYREMAQADEDWSEWESMPTLSVTSSRQRQGAAAG